MKFRDRSRFAAALAVALAVAAGPAAAAKPRPQPKTAPSVQSVIDCRAVTEDAQRLACYDKAVAVMQTAQTTGDLLTLDKAQRRAARKQAFGLPLTSLAILDTGEKPEEADRITVKIASVTQNPYGAWTFKLDDGAVWRQIDDKTLDRPAHPGSTAVISRGVLGSFFMKVDGQQAIKVHRDS